MAVSEQASVYATHEVINQPPPLQDYNCYECYPVLQEAVRRYGGDWDEASIRALGEKAGSAAFIETGYLANKHVPELKMHDRGGNRLDVVEFHPAYHEIMRTGVSFEVHALPWNRPVPGAHAARAAKHFLLGQPEQGPGCPLAMTFASVPVLRLQPEIAEEWVPRVGSSEYDPRFIPAEEKTGCQIGMAMTEKQGGSDVRANTTEAEPIGAEGPGEEYLLTGHKWFVSGAMGDAFLALANTHRGLSCFLVPRFLPDGTLNRWYIQRVKDKMGNRSNATCEVELCGTWARMVGEEGRGVRNIIRMVNHTRLDCTIGTSSIMRQALLQAIHYTSHRSAFGELLVHQPLMKNVLADLALESEAATTMMMHLAHLYDRVAEDPALQPLVRISTAVTKYWTCKRTPNMVYECLECHGGDGYVEEGPMPRFYREAPVNSVWEGSGNVLCLDVLKTFVQAPDAVPMFLEELGKAKGSDARYDAWLGAMEKELANPADAEVRARRVVERLALASQAALLIQFAPDFVADAFVGSRLVPDHGQAFGTLGASTAFDAILGRAAPQFE